MVISGVGPLVRPKLVIENLYVDPRTLKPRRVDFTTSLEWNATATNFVNKILVGAW